MPISNSVIYETRTDLEYYQVVERIYSGRFSRLLYAGESNSAQSGIPLDGKEQMLFGYCQRFIELIEDIKPKHILLIGGGVYTLPTYLSKHHPSIKVDIVEPDKGLDSIAERFFNFKPSSNLSLVHELGLHFLKSADKTYDLILVDAYSRYKIPEEILTKRFAKYAAKALKKDGLLAANVISDLAPLSALNRMRLAFAKSFKYSKAYPAEPEANRFANTNYIYIASSQEISVKLPYPSLDWGSGRD